MAKVEMFRPYVNERAVELAAETLRSGWIGEGPRVREFEQRIGALVGSRFPVTVNSGTTALHLALVLAGVEPGDEVITTAQTMLATTTAILMAGAHPVYADVEYDTGNLAAADVARRVTDRTRAILAVDWAGYPCDWDALLAIAGRHGLAAVEDAAHSLGGRYKDKTVGSVAPITCFSFQAIKHLTTGDGGMVCVSSEADYERAVQLRWFGIDRGKRKPSVIGEPEWNVTELGFKYHMNDIAAAVGLGNLDDFGWILERRQKIADAYRAALDGVPGVRLFRYESDRSSANWLFSIHVERREEFCRALAAREIMASVVHLRIDRNDVCGGERPDLPELARFTETHVSLPIHPRLSDEDVQRVIDAVRAGW